MSSTKQLLEEDPSPAPLATTRRESGMGEHAMDTLGLGTESIVMPVPHPRLLPLSKIPNGDILSKHHFTFYIISSNIILTKREEAFLQWLPLIIWSNITCLQMSDNIRYIFHYPCTERGHAEFTVFIIYLEMGPSLQPSLRIFSPLHLVPADAEYKLNIRKNKQESLLV